MFKSGSAVPVQLLASLEAEAVAAAKKAAAAFAGFKAQYETLKCNADTAASEREYYKNQCLFVRKLEELKGCPLVVGDIFQDTNYGQTQDYQLTMVDRQVSLVPLSPIPREHWSLFSWEITPMDSDQWHVTYVPVTEPVEA